MQAEIKNALTIDVEDYFQVSALAPYIERASWERQPCRVERNVDRILDMLERARVKATFFTLGWIAERYPHVVKRIAQDGHELASHGYAHLRASDQSPAEFKYDVTHAKALLEDLSGKPVIGYRAPSFSIGEKNLWALDTLREAGYRYSSSIYPVKHDHYGMPHAPRFAFSPIAHDKDFIELPATTVRMFGRNLPAAGGGYFRLLPYAASRWLLQRVNRADGQPAIFYFHPWEIDPQQPRPRGLDAKTRFRHYVNLRHTEGRLRRLVSDFRWDRVDEVFLGSKA
jgi:polysaccharide deacetylase family protein (PEP-CTERM system associated)